MTTSGASDPPQSRAVDIVRHADGAAERRDDTLAVEDPLEIRLGGVPLAVVMRTPGDDDDLVRGFFLTEGILLDPTEIAAIDRLDDSRVDVRLAPGIEVQAEQFQRNMFASSSCGVCGKASIDQVRLFARPAKPFTVSHEVIARLTDRLRDHQPTFDDTGGLHAAGLFGIDGDVFGVKEDVGRHNAVDKVIGAATRERWPLPPCLLVVSGRQSFEIVQKAALAGIGGVVGVSAPSSLAVNLARELDMLLVGFARAPNFNVYAGDDHVAR